MMGDYDAGYLDGLQKAKEVLQILYTKQVEKEIDKEKPNKRDTN